MRHNDCAFSFTYMALHNLHRLVLIILDPLPNIELDFAKGLIIIYQIGPEYVQKRLAMNISCQIVISPASIEHISGIL